MDLEDTQKLCKLTERCEAAEARVEELERSLNAKWADYVDGTPCAAIRWVHERNNYLSYIDELRELLMVPLKAYLHHVEGEPVVVEDLDVWIGRVQQALADVPPRGFHPDDAAVDRFAAAMKAKLARARTKGCDGWGDPDRCSAGFLADLLVGHVGKGNAGNLEDIANLAMMLHQRGDDPAMLSSSLARRDAWKQAEALAALHLEDCATLQDVLERKHEAINELRRQAEGE